MKANCTFASDDMANAGIAIPVFGHGPGLLVIGRDALQSPRQVDPELDAGSASFGHLGMDDASACREALRAARPHRVIVAEIVRMPHVAGEQPGDGLEAPMRMRREAAAFDVEMIPEHEGVEIA